jgi:hypothetical protein
MEIVKRTTRTNDGIKYEVIIDGVTLWEKNVTFAGHRRRFFIEAAREQEATGSKRLNDVISKIPL